MVSKENILFVLDLETTGTDYLFDRVLEITIYKLSMVNYQFEKVYDTILYHDINQEVIKNGWPVKQGFITLDEIAKGRNPVLVKEEIQKLLQGQVVTSYNTDFDMTFLRKRLELTNFIVPYCLMKKSTPLVRIPGYYDEFKWPKLQEAYKYFYGDLKEERHRSDYDTELAVKIAIGLDKFEKIREFLRMTIAEERIVIITYTSQKNETLTRKIQPLQFKRGETLVEAFDFLRNENRTFNLVRISEIKEV